MSLKDGDDTITVHSGKQSIRHSKIKSVVKLNMFHFVISARGPIDVDSGTGNDEFPFKGARGDINITSGDGSKNLSIEETVGNVYIDLQGKVK